MNTWPMVEGMMAGTGTLLLFGWVVGTLIEIPCKEVAIIGGIFWGLVCFVELIEGVSRGTRQSQ